MPIYKRKKFSIMELLELYKKDLKLASESNEDRLIFNDMPAKANIFMNILLNHAKKSVKIYSHNLNNEVTSLDGFTQSFEEVLKNENIEVKILLNEDSNNSSIQDLLKKYSEKSYNNKIRRLTNKDCIKKVFEDDVHFTIIDEEAYRIEHDTVNFQAIGNFNNKEMCKGLINLYNNLFSDNCSKI